MTDHEVTIVGAGFGGMGAAIALKRLGYGAGSQDLLILEREDDLGGTWHVNHYPGLAVDIASVTYSYSFEPNPHWEHWFARGIGEFSRAHLITGADAWTAAFVIMALAMVVTRLTATGVRAARLSHQKVLTEGAVALYR